MLITPDTVALVAGLVSLVSMYLYARYSTNRPITGIRHFLVRAGWSVVVGLPYVVFFSTLVLGMTSGVGTIVFYHALGMIACYVWGKVGRKEKESSRSHQT